MLLVPIVPGRRPLELVYITPVETPLLKVLISKMDLKAVKLDLALLLEEMNLLT